MKKIKIIKIEKKPWFLRGGIEHWWVWVEGDNTRYSCWAGVPSLGTPIKKRYLIYSLEQKIKERYKIAEDENLQSLIDTEI